MPGNNRIFVSHTHADNARCESLLTALDAWRLDYWYDGQQLDAGQELSPRLQDAITHRDVLLRVCTTNTPKSYWMNLERSAFHAQQFQQRGKGGKKSDRVSIDLVLDAEYASGMVERAGVTINTVGRSEAQWLADLASALGVKQVARQGALTRRDVLGLGAAAAVTVAGLGGGAAIATSRLKDAAKPYPTPRTVPFRIPNPQSLDARIKWYIAAGGDETPGLVLGHDSLIALSQGGLYALNPHDGSMLWWRPDLKGSANSTPAIAEETIYVAAGGLSGSLLALQLTDGKTIWSVTTKSTFEDLGLALAGNAIYMLNDGNHIVAFSAKDGSQLWESDKKIHVDTLASSALVADSTAVYIGDGSGAMSAFNLADGSVRWSYSAGGSFSSTPVLGNGVLIAASKDQNVYAFNTADGSVRWSFSTGTTFGYTPTIVNNTVFVPLYDHVGALDLATGKLLWSVQVVDSATNSSYVDGSVGVRGDLLFVPASEKLLAFSITSQKLVWTLALNPYNNATAPVVDATTAYLPTSKGLIYALDTTATA